jgi:hypothetical protein
MSDPIPVKAAPTKSFFVRMLTRGIELRDAILDLLDNCIDGIVRSTKPKASVAKPYASFFAEINASPDGFVIQDNCGGIPRHIATDVAFRLGRPTGAPYEKLETVGVYGIGMKRAIFKMGQNAVVTSEHNGSRFKVRIPQEWLDDDLNWDLEMEEEAPTGKSGTRIEVPDLYPEIAREFTTTESNFLTETLPKAIRELYAVILGKGFTVRLNGMDLEPVEFKLLVSAGRTGEAAINPYVFRGRIGSVHAEVVVGFYRKPLTEVEIDEESESPKADLDQAGWSVICNDRLVLRSDKTAVTGWGTANVPRFHNQFSSIAGVVTLRSTDPSLLPLNTTKRGIEMHSDVYFRLLEYMREGLKQFTDYTYRWKARDSETRNQFQDAAPVPTADIPAAIPTGSYSKVSSKKLAKEDAEADVFKPVLPKPPKEESDSRRIVFTRPLADIMLLASEMLDDESATPGEVGEACFDVQLEKHKKPKRKS